MTDIEEFNKWAKSQASKDLSKLKNLTNVTDVNELRSNYQQRRLFDDFTERSPGQMAMMKFQFEDVHVIFCDEISMVGSMKLLKINFRLQDLVDGDQRHKYMGGISFVSSGRSLNSQLID
jgi:hypothetical protein